MAGFTTQSASVRSSIMPVVSPACMLTKSISPMMLLCGAMTGVMPSGSSSPMATIFSLTVCLAR